MPVGWSNGKHHRTTRRGQGVRYEFVVQGAVPADVAADLPDMTCADYPTGGTSVFGRVRDEADVLSLRARLVQHGLCVVHVRPLPD